MKVFLSSSQYYDIIASCVILNRNVLPENIALMRCLFDIRPTLGQRLVLAGAPGHPAL